MMDFSTIFEPTRRALSPILADESVIDRERHSPHTFYNARARFVSRHVRLIVACAAGFFLLAAWVLFAIGAAAPLQNLSLLFSIVIGGLPAAAAVREKLAKIRFDIDTLMLIGAGLAVYIGSPFEAALLLFLFALSGGLETYALDRTEHAIRSLRELAPQDTNLMVDGQVRRVPLRELRIGTRVLVRPGERVPVDGVVVDGTSSVNEAVITGEHLPRDCAVGDSVFAGTQNLQGRLVVEATRLGGDTTVGRMVELVTRARKNPARAQRLIDRIGPTYSVAVVALSVAVGGLSALMGIPGTESLRRAIAVLIVASPCALVIATPVAYLAAIAAAARRGVLIKGGAFLEAIAKVRTVIFDKTGTLTTGEIRLTTVDPLGNLSEREAMEFAGALESSSTHPLSRAVMNELQSRGFTSRSASEYVATPGQGSSGIVDGRQTWIGRPESAPLESIRRQVLERVTSLRHAGRTVSVLTVNGDAALFGFEDSPRPGGVECITALRRQGVTRIEMFTGDHEVVASTVAARLGLDAHRSQLKPEDKLELTRDRKNELGTVMFVGDGVNDAPAMAHADVGVAMGGIGSDLTLETAHVVVLNDRLESVAWLHRHARRSARIVRENLTLAIGVIAVLSAFAALGRIPLPLAVLGHEGSTVLVALNALRLLRSSDPKAK